MRRENPAVGEDTFTKFKNNPSNKPMTIQGSINKTIFLLIILVITSVYSWNYYSQDIEGSFDYGEGMLAFLFTLGLIIAIFPRISPFLSPIYTIMQGLFVGCFSVGMNAVFGYGIIIQSVLLVFGVLFCLVVAYKLKLIPETDNRRLMIFALIGAIMVTYLVAWISHEMGSPIPYFHESPLLVIMIHLLFVAVASYNVVLDFDFIEEGAACGAPKYMEWYAAFSLIVSIVWIYLGLIIILGRILKKD